MKTYEFTIIASSDEADFIKLSNRLFECGCGDSTVAFQKGVIIVEFDRMAKSFLHALTSAIADVRKADVNVLHIEPDHLVNLSDIAVRAGVTRSAVSHYARGERGKRSQPPSQGSQPTALFGIG